MTLLRRTWPVVSILVLFASLVSGQPQPPSPGGGEAGRSQEQQADTERGGAALPSQTGTGNVSITIQTPSTDTRRQKPQRRQGEYGRNEAPVDWWGRLSSFVQGSRL